MEKINALQNLSAAELTSINGGGLWAHVKELIDKHTPVGSIIMYILEYGSQNMQDEVWNDIQSGDIWSGYA